MWAGAPAVTAGRLQQTKLPTSNKAVGPTDERITLHGHELSYTDTGDRTTDRLRARPDELVDDLVRARWTGSRPNTGSSLRTCSGTASRRNRPATTRSARTRQACGTCSTRSASTGATLVGHSLGGGIALQMAYLFPDRVDAAGAGQQRWPRPRAEPAAAGGHPAGQRTGAAGARIELGAQHRRHRPAGLVEGRAAGDQPQHRRGMARACPVWPTATPGGRSWPPAGRSSTCTARR